MRLFLKNRQPNPSCIFPFSCTCPCCLVSRFHLRSGDKDCDAVLENQSSSCYNCNQWRVRSMRDRGRRSGELPRMTLIPVDSWSALFHRSSYCLLGGLSGIKQVSLQIALENNISHKSLPCAGSSLCVIWWPLSTVTLQWTGFWPMWFCWMKKLRDHSLVDR